MFNAIILLLMLMSLCVTLGLIPAASVSRGPHSVALRSGITAGLAFGLSMVASAFLWDPAQWGATCVGPVNVGLFAGACTLVLPGYMLVHAYGVAKRHRAIAPLVSKFMLERFDEINQARDGTITNNELEMAGRNLSLTSEERALLAYAKSQQGAIGHIIGSFMTDETILMPLGRSVIPTTRRVEKHIYGINKADIQSYPNKVLEEFKDW